VNLPHLRLRPDGERRNENTSQQEQKAAAVHYSIT
jgi:hypothetical protein